MSNKFTLKFFLEWREKVEIAKKYHDMPCTSGNGGRVLLPMYVPSCIKHVSQEHDPMLSPTSCLSYERFDRVLGTAPSSDPTVVHSNLVRCDGAQLAPKSSLRTEGATSRH